MLVTAENEVQTLSKLDDTKKFVEALIQKTPRNQSKQTVSLDDLQNIKRTMEESKLVILHTINDRLFTDEVFKQMREKTEELTNELETTKHSLENSQMVLQEAENQFVLAEKFKELEQMVEELDSI